MVGSVNQAYAINIHAATGRACARMLITCLVHVTGSMAQNQAERLGVGEPENHQLVSKRLILSAASPLTSVVNT